jgi:DNA-binding IclR family transcriptional regulator
MSLAEAFVANTDVAREFGGLWKDAAHAPDETMLLSVLDGHDVVYVAARNGARPLGLAFNVGMRLPAHLAATGKAMLAFQDADAVRRLYPPGTLPRMARKGPRTAAELMRELSVVRRCGYSVDDESIREGVYCMGAPVFDAAGRPVAGIGVCINKALRGGDMGERHRRAVLDAARALSQRLGATAALAAPAESPARRKASKAANP